ncbi:ABC transporter ATP-binding protein [Clostridium botulinum]|uniref:ABC transporter ATP-binding protein n=1 Tax=Clostridium botulinum TaxID=1491 RepID=A0A846JKW7_CLOBO|nr:ABC transporter ATP-binding protein [Clostridium botulinum]ACA54447.1 peptide ABC transporter, Pep4E family, ATP-binding protein [Clostridium botulinum A3 str. Loch Maree]NFH67092.1 ABC transporter ATP-binding protein [Clostridium botulinum]NFJ10565.1 ABC transporter ATP-binding protein [Clostridium botulinum]NFK15580.1 ABC transporter ATP-binding protein [Clostridium botulinum]NFM95309.1 ABC transporter ATP-binding protein [Clostridium botulinum]
MGIIELKEVYKIYGTEKGKIALKNINLTVNEGEFISIMGPSGSGKSTLLKLASTIEKPSAGSILINGIDVKKINEEERREFRRKNFSFVFQDVKLIKNLTIKDNIIYPMLLENNNKKCIEEAADKILKLLHIEDLQHRRVWELSGGQSQKGEIGRALIQRKKIMFLDEPTGRLDFNSRKKIMEIFKNFNAKEKCTIFLVTHDPFVASYAKRVLFIKDGEIYSEIYMGEDQENFYKDILNFNMFLGGRTNEF